MPFGIALVRARGSPQTFTNSICPPLRLSTTLSNHDDGKQTIFHLLQRAEEADGGTSRREIAVVVARQAQLSLAPDPASNQRAAISEHSKLSTAVNKLFCPRVPFAPFLLTTILLYPSLLSLHLPDNVAASSRCGDGGCRMEGNASRVLQGTTPPQAALSLFEGHLLLDIGRVLGFRLAFHQLCRRTAVSPPSLLSWWTRSSPSRLLACTTATSSRRQGGGETTGGRFDTQG